MSQPDDASPEDREPRKDINTRKVIDVLERKVVEKMDERLKPYVTYAVLLGILTGVFGTGALIVTAVLTPATSASASTSAKVDRLETKVEKLVDAVGDLKVSAAETRATYNVIVKQRSRAEAKAEAESTIAKEK